MNNPPSYNETIFEVNNLTYMYDGKFLALDQVNMQVHQGERVAILGANGSGKSTLLKILDGLYFPSHGSMIAFGKSIDETLFLDEAFNYTYRRQVGLIFQDSDVQLFSPSVWDEVAFAPLQLGISKDEVRQRVDDSLRALRIEKLRDRSPHRLSGGEKKRVAIASILSLDPQVWLMDEPTTGLDPRSKAWLDDFIYAQGESGKTIVIATHDLDLAASVADRVYLFDEDHHIVKGGDPDQILADYDILLKCNLVPDHVHRQRQRNPEHTRSVFGPR